MSIVSVILAAGQGRRMGTPKALLTSKGCPFIQHIITTQWKAGIRRCLLVTQIQLQPHIEQLMAPFASETSMCIEWVWSSPHATQLDSLCAALAALAQTESPTHSAFPSTSTGPALLVGPVDQGPYPVELIEGLQEGFDLESDSVRIPTWQQQPGHPVLIGAGFCPRIQAGHPQGLRGIFMEHPTSLEYMPLPFEEIAHNLNTREQYEQFLQR